MRPVSRAPSGRPAYRFAGTAAAFVAAVAALGPNSVLANRNRSPVPTVSLCSPAVVGDIRPVCAPPAAASRIEQSAAAQLTTPRGLVWRLSGLRLRQLSIERARGQIEAIDYLFGWLPANPRFPASLGVPQYNARRPLYVLVRESRGLGEEKRPVLFQSQTNVGPGAWHFVANLPHRSFEVSIITNEGRSVVKRIGDGLLRRASG